MNDHIINLDKSRLYYKSNYLRDIPNVAIIMSKATNFLIVYNEGVDDPVEGKIYELPVKLSPC